MRTLLQNLRGLGRGLHLAPGRSLQPPLDLGNSNYPPEVEVNLPQEGASP